jgi:O-antigen ligase
MISNSTIAAVIVLISFILLIQKKYYSEVFLLFLILLTFSDSRLPVFSFTAQIKPIISVLIIWVAVKNLKYKNPIFKYFIPYFLLTLFLTVFFSPIFNVSIQKNISYITLYLYTPIFFMHLYYDNKLKKIFYFSFLIITIGLILHFLKFQHITTLVGRYRGLLGNPNGLGIFLTVHFFLYQCFISFQKQLLNKYETNIYWIVLIYSIILSGSRTALGSVIIFYVIKYLINFSFIFTNLIIIMLFIYLKNIEQLLYSVIISLGLERYFRLSTIKEGSGRVYAWDFIWRKINSTDFDYFLGYGTYYGDYYIYTFSGYDPKLIFHQGNIHNSFLTIWMESGIIGLVLLFLPVFFIFYMGNKKYKIAFPILYGSALSMYYESWLAASLNPFTIVFVMILTIFSINIPQSNNEQSIELEKN